MSDLTLKDVAGAIGWLDSFGSDEIEFDSSQVTENEDESISIHVEGYYRPKEGSNDHKVAPKFFIEATFVLKDASINPADDFEDDLEAWGDEEDEEE